MIIDGKYEANISCKMCRFRHPAHLSCEESKRHADEARELLQSREGSGNEYYETFFMTLSKGALQGLETALRQAAENEWDDKVQQALTVHANEIRARIQHIDAGDLQAPGSFA